jgi:small-conductance mechanosensitive channel
MPDFQSFVSGNLFKIVLTVIIIAFLYLIKALINKLIIKKKEKIKERYIARQINNYIVLLLVIILIIALWFEWFQSIFTFLSIAVAAFIIISKELLLNIVAHGVIITRELFEAGDRIQISNYAGDIMETGPVFFTISEIRGENEGDEATGRVIKVPNSLVLTNSVVNYSRGIGLIWNEIKFSFFPETNLDKVRSIALKIAEKNSYHFTKHDIKTLQNNSEEIMFTTTTPSTKINLNEGLLDLTIRYPCKFHKRNQTEQKIIQEFIVSVKNENDIKLYIRQPAA